jgi:hypothetical protein
MLELCGAAFAAMLALGAAFWLFVAVSLVFFLFFVEKEWPGCATFLVLAVLAALNWGFKIPVFAAMWANPLIAIGGVLGFFAIGTVWAIVRWRVFLDTNKRRLRRKKAEFIRNKKLEIKAIDPIPEEHKVEYARFVKETNWREKAIAVNPQIGEHKTSIYIWIAYWPFSMLWTVINDPVKRIVLTIYEGLAEWLQGMSDKVFADDKQDFEIKK